MMLKSLATLALTVFLFQPGAAEEESDRQRASDAAEAVPVTASGLVECCVGQTSTVAAAVDTNRVMTPLVAIAAQNVMQRVPPSTTMVVPVM